uniref:BRCT domain-containing protein n=1 Tax=Aegilops tauschii TaxID=37682 RepID=M8C3R6_AEGTA
MTGDGGFLRELRFKLVGFDKEKEDEWPPPEADLHTAGDENVHQQQQDRGPRDNGSVLINELWLDDTLQNGALADINNILYRPPVSLGGIKGAQYLNISHTGFSGHEGHYLERLVDMVGAQNVGISNGSYFICNSLADYDASKARDVFTVNKKWLEDSVKEWEILSVDVYVSWPRRATSRKYRTPIKDNTAMNSDREASSTGKKAKIRSPEERDIVKRQALSTGCMKTYPPAEEHAASLCKRRLNFDWRRLSDYKPSEMVVQVQIPRSNMEKKIGTDEFKGALSGSYAEMANIHSGGQCIKNTISASSFRVSRNSGEVIMDKPQLVEYEEKLALANRKQFVLMVQAHFKEKCCSLPDDIAEWLACIIDVGKVSDRVLKNHINMQHPVDIYGSFVAMYYILMRLKEEDFTQFVQIMNSNIMRKYIPWVQNFRWKLLNDTVKYIHPKMAELNNLRSQVSNSGAIGQAVIYKPKKRDPDLSGILEVVRDCFTHPAMIHQVFLLPVLLAEGYPRLLFDLQRKLFELGHLMNLR